MTTKAFNIEWLNHNSIRNYPLADTATGLDTSGSFQIPNDFIVELDLPIAAAANIDIGRFHISRIDAYSLALVITVGYTNGASQLQDVASAVVPTSAFTGGKKNLQFALGGVGNFSDTVGKIVISSLEMVQQQPPGSWEFGLEAGRLDPDAVRPMLRCINSVTVVNGTQVSAKLYHDLHFVAGSNCRIDVGDAETLEPVVKFNFIRGEGTVEDCTCYGDAASSDPIRTINMVTPDANSNLTLVGTNCLELVPIANGLKLVDKCAEPCCGSYELDVITQDLEKLKAESGQLRNFVDQLLVNVNVFNSIVLGSKLGDASCAPT